MTAELCVNKKEYHFILLPCLPHRRQPYNACKKQTNEKMMSESVTFTREQTSFNTTISQELGGLSYGFGKFLSSMFSALYHDAGKLLIVFEF